MPSQKVSDFPVAPSVNSDAIVPLVQLNGLTETNYKQSATILAADYLTGMIISTWGGCFTTPGPASGNISYTKIGDVVSCRVPLILQTASATSPIILTTPLPPELRPSDSQYFDFIVYNPAPARQLSLGLIDAFGNITIYLNTSLDPFANAFNAGFTSQTFTYSLI